MGRLQSGDFRLDRKQLGEKILDVRRQCNEELRFTQSAERRRIGARGIETGSQRRLGFAKMRSESGIDAGQTGDRVQIFEAEAEARVQHPDIQGPGLRSSDWDRGQTYDFTCRRLVAS